MRDARIGRRVDDAPLNGLDGEFNGLRFVDLVKIEGDRMTFVGVRETARCRLEMILRLAFGMTRLETSPTETELAARVAISARRSGTRCVLGEFAQEGAGGRRLIRAADINRRASEKTLYRTAGFRVPLRRTAAGTGSGAGIAHTLRSDMESCMLAMK